MAQAQNTLSPALMSALLASVKSGQIRPANLVKSIQADSLVTLDNLGAKFTRTPQGKFMVSFYKNDAEVSQEEAGDRTEAKLLVIDYLVSASQTPAQTA